MVQGKRAAAPEVATAWTNPPKAVSFVRRNESEPELTARKLTIPPLPSVAEAIGAFLPTRFADADLTAPWSADGKASLVFSRSAWALGLLAMEAAERLGRPPVFWLPDYFCNDATHPLRDTGAVLRHYPIDRNLEPDWEACGSMAQAEKPDMFVLVHYFGRPADTAEALRFCRNHGAWMVEDAAHALGPTADIGQNGDAVFYSPHKNLALPHCSILVYRHATDSDIVRIERIRRQLPQTTPAVFSWLIRRMVQACLPAPLLARMSGGGPETFMQDGTSGAPLAPPFCGVIAQRLLIRAKANIEAVADKRRENWRRITEAAAAIDGWSPLTPPPENWVPYRAVMQCRDQARAENIYRFLRRNHLPVESWPDLADEVKQAPDRHTTALAFRRTLLLLPVHQTLDTESYCRALGRDAADIA